MRQAIKPDWTFTMALTRPGGLLVNFLAAGVSAVMRLATDKLRERVSVADYGATGLTSHDATAAFNAAIAALPAGGGEIWVNPNGKYKLTAPVIYNKPVMWRGGVQSDITTNTNGGDVELPLIYWGVAAATPGALLHQKPAAVGTVIFGGGVDGIFFDGSNLAAAAYHLDNSRYARVRGKARNCTVAGLIISSDSGTNAANGGIFSKKNRVLDWDYIYGVTAATANSHGILLRGNGVAAPNGTPSTQQKIDRVFALIKHGAALRIEETDNCQIGSAQAVGDAGAGGGGGLPTGCTAWLTGTGAQESFNNHFDYIVGELRQEAGVFGTTFNHMTYEGSKITQVSGTPSWHGRIVDFSGSNLAAKSDRFASHEYPLRKVIPLSVGQFISSSNTTASFGLQWPCFTLRDAANDTLTAVIAIDAEMSTGVIESVSVLHGTNTAAAGNYEVTVSISTAGLLDSAPVVTQEKQTTIALNSVQYQIKETAFTPAVEQVFTKGDVILLQIARAGGVANDTATTDLCILGARVKFRSNGPTTATAMTAANMPSWNMP